MQTLAAYFKKTHHSSSRLNAHPELNARLVAMCKGWGGKEEVRRAALAPSASLHRVRAIAAAAGRAAPPAAPGGAAPWRWRPPGRSLSGGRSA